MKNRYNKILIFLLALAMAFGLLQNFGSPAHATDVKDATELKTAIANGGSIKLTADISITDLLEIEANKPVSLDLNGYGILQTGYGRVIFIYEGGKLELSDGRPITSR